MNYIIGKASRKYTGASVKVTYIGFILYQRKELRKQLCKGDGFLASHISSYSNLFSEEDK